MAVWKLFLRCKDETAEYKQQKERGTSVKTVFLYAGQGSQKAGMGKDLYESFSTYRAVIDSMQVETDLAYYMHEAPLEELSKTEITQPCMAAFAAGVTAVLRENGIVPDAACGLSLGEYGALHAAGVLDAKEYVKLCEFRGSKMAEAAKGQACAMSAILGQDAAAVEAACEACVKEGYVTVANYNCPGQYVICGEEAAVAATEEYLKEHGAKRCVRLNVSGPFHTKFMKPAGDALQEYFAGMTWNKPQIPVVLNVTGDYLKDGEDLKERMVQQVQNSVQFESTLRLLLAAGATNFIEIGPGNTLSGFLKKTAKEVGAEINIYNIETKESLISLIDKKELFPG